MQLDRAEAPFIAAICILYFCCSHIAGPLGGWIMIGPLGGEFGPLGGWFCAWFTPLGGLLGGVGPLGWLRHVA